MSLPFHTSYLPSHSFLVPPRAQRHLDHIFRRAQRSAFTTKTHTRSHYGNSCRGQRGLFPKRRSIVRWHPEQNNTPSLISTANWLSQTCSTSKTLVSRHLSSTSKSGDNSKIRPKSRLADPSLNNIWNQFLSDEKTPQADQQNNGQEVAKSEAPSRASGRLRDPKEIDKRLRTKKNAHTKLNARPVDIFSLLFSERRESVADVYLPSLVSPGYDKTLWQNIYRRQGSEHSFSEYSVHQDYNGQTQPSHRDSKLDWQDPAIRPYTPRIPNDSSNQEKEAIYLDFVEHFLPPHLKLRRPEKYPQDFSHAVSWSDSITTLDTPQPAVFDRETRFSDLGLHDLVEEESFEQIEVWEKPQPQKFAFRLLRILEEARNHGVDVLSILINRHQENTVFWIVQILLGPAEEFVQHTINPSKETFSTKLSANNRKTCNGDQQSETLFTISEEIEKIRRKHGLGIVLSSLSHMFVAGWRKQIKETSIKDDLRTIDIASLFGKTTQLDLYRPDTSLSGRLDPLFIDKKKNNKIAQITSENIFKNAVYILTYLHSLDQIPKSVFSSTNPLLFIYHDLFLKEMGAVALDAFDKQGVFTLPKQARLDPIEWSLWLNLVAVIASEHGLGVGAYEVLNAMEDYAVFQSDGLLHNEISQFMRDRPSIDEKITIPEMPQQILFPRLVETAEDTDKPRLRLPRSMLLAISDALLTYNSFDSSKKDTMSEWLRLLEKVSKLRSGAVDGGVSYPSLRGRILNHPEMDLRKPYGETVLNIKLEEEEEWPIEVWHEVLLGMIERVDKEGVIRIWSGIERNFADEKMNAEFLNNRQSVSGKRTIEFADTGNIQHPIHILSKLLKHLKTHEIARPFLMEHVLRTAVTKSTALNPAILNPLLSFAATTQNRGLAELLVQPPSLLLHPSTLLTMLNLHLRFGQSEKAKAIVSFMKDHDISNKDVELGIITKNAYRESFEAGNKLVDYALTSKASEPADEASDEDESYNTEPPPWSEEITLSPVSQQARVFDGVGDSGWIAALDAAVDAGDRDRAEQAFKGLNIDLEDMNSVTKMGNHLFTIMLKGVVARQGSESGMRMFKTYCIDLSKLNDPDVMTRASAGIVKPESGRQSILQTSNMKGHVVPTVVTLKTIVHQALRERRRWHVHRRKQTSAGNVVEDVDIRNMGFERVLRWARYAWDQMGQGVDAWRELCNTKLNDVTPIDRARRKQENQHKDVKLSSKDVGKQSIDGVSLRE